MLGCLLFLFRGGLEQCTDPGSRSATQKDGPPVPGLRAGGDVLRRHDGRSSGAGCCFHSLVLRAVEVCRRRGGASGQPWRCLWRRFSQITMTRPLRRITLHLSQIFLTLGWTFICLVSSAELGVERSCSAVTENDPATVEVVRRELHHHAVLREDPDVVLAHLARDVSEHLVPVRQLDPEHRVRESLDDRALDLDDTVLLGHILRRSVVCVLRTVKNGRPSTERPTDNLTAAGVSRPNRPCPG